MLSALKALDIEERIGERVRWLNGVHRRRVETARPGIIWLRGFG
jgi:hypothetical protein